jgi:signal transduction histidine kinase
MDVYLKRLEGYTETMASLQKLDEIELTPAEIDFNNLCDELENVSGILIPDKKLIFNRAGGGTLHIDKPAVMQVYENLAANAARYAENTVEVTFEANGNIFKVAAADNGPGFSPDALKNAAEPYYRGDKDISASAHFGIGLYISKLLCEKHGGTLTVENSGGGKVTASFTNL